MTEAFDPKNKSFSGFDCILINTYVNKASPAGRARKVLSLYYDYLHEYQSTSGENADVGNQ